jgi:hypothetical protein
MGYVEVSAPAAGLDFRLCRARSAEGAVAL